MRSCVVWRVAQARGDTGGCGDMWSAGGDTARRVEVGPACGDTAGHGDVSEPHDATGRGPPGVHLLF